MFKLSPRLTELLKRIKPENAQPKDLVFKQENGRTYSSDMPSKLW
jgi:hypothetical protein